MIGKNIKNRRIELNYNLKKLSELTGISKSTLSRYENDSSSIPISKLNIIADKLGVDVSFLTEEYTDTDVHTEEYYRLKSLSELYFNSVITWCNDKLFSEEEKIKLLDHFSELLLRYKVLCESRLNAKLYWDCNSENEIDYFKNKDQNLSLDDIKKQFLKNYIETQTESTSKWVLNFASYNKLE